MENEKDEKAQKRGLKREIGGWGRLWPGYRPKKLRVEFSGEGGPGREGQ